MADPSSSDPIARQSTQLTCLGVYNTQCSYDPHFYREVGLTPAANHPFMPPFYDLAYEEMDTAARRIFDEAAPMTWFHSGGPPVFIFYPTDDDPIPPDIMDRRTWETGEEDPLADRAVHHPKMGRIIKEKLDALGVECTLHINVGKQIPETQAKMVEFFARHLLQ